MSAKGKLAPQLILPAALLLCYHILAKAHGSRAGCPVCPLFRPLTLCYCHLDASFADRQQLSLKGTPQMEKVVKYHQPQSLSRCSCSVQQLPSSANWTCVHHVLFIDSCTCPTSAGSQPGLSVAGSARLLLTTHRWLHTTLKSHWHGCQSSTPGWKTLTGVNSHTFEHSTMFCKWAW